MSDLFLIAFGTLVVVGLVVSCFGSASAQQKANPVVMMKTSLGDIAIELYADKAPETTTNFLWYVDNKFYDGLIFHRVISNFMIQGGGFTKDMTRKEPKPPIKNEADNGLSNAKGTIAMARTGDPHSASSQFFINVKDNKPLDFKSKDNGQTWGYCVFGMVIGGMDVVEKIRQVPTKSVDVYNDVPVEPVVITKAYRLGDDEIKALKATQKQ
jgi:cyclophilin family peptidyl-prolyl cis-trans isomerase